MLRAVFRRYKILVAKYPVSIQSLQTGLLMASGDLLAQTFVEKKSFNSIDFPRIGKFSMTGILVMGPVLTIWYKKMDDIIGTKGDWIPIKKVAADQLLFTPIFLFIILVVVYAAQGSTAHEAKKRVMKDYPEVLKTNYCLWPTVQLVNFTFIPLEYRVIFVQLVAVFWNMYLSTKINKELSPIKDP